MADPNALAGLRNLVGHARQLLNDNGVPKPDGIYTADQVETYARRRAANLLAVLVLQLVLDCLPESEPGELQVVIDRAVERLSDGKDEYRVGDALQILRGDS